MAEQQHRFQDLLEQDFQVKVFTANARRYFYELPTKLNCLPQLLREPEGRLRKHSRYKAQYCRQSQNKCLGIDNKVPSW